MPLLPNISWNVPLLDASMDRRVHRVGTRPGEFVPDLCGVSGIVQGGVRPHRGFVYRRWFGANPNYTGYQPGEDSDGGYVNTDNTPAGGDLSFDSRPLEVYDVFGFTLPVGIGNSTFATGWVVRYRDRLSILRMAMEWEYNGGWYFRELRGAAGTGSGVLGLPAQWGVAEPEHPMSVLVHGRTLYIFQAGKPVAGVRMSPSGSLLTPSVFLAGPGAPGFDLPLRLDKLDFYLTDNEPVPGGLPPLRTYSPPTNVEGTVVYGPGDLEHPPPLLGEGDTIRIVDLGPATVPFSQTTQGGGPLTPHPDRTRGFCDETNSSPAVVSAHPGRRARPLWQMAGDGAPDTLPEDSTRYITRNEGVYGMKKQAHAQAVRAIDLGYLTRDFNNGIPGTAAQGATRRRIERLLQRLATLGPGDYAFAYQMFDASTGQYSALSTIVNKRAADFTLRNAPITRIFALEIPKVSGDPPGTLGYFQAKWTHIVIYRSLKATEAGGAGRGAVLRREAIVPIHEQPEAKDSYVVKYSTSGNEEYEATPSARGDFIYWFTLKDNALAFMPPYTGTAEYLSVPPFAGAAEILGGVAVVSSIRVPPGVIDVTEEAWTGLGEIRWSDPGSRSIEVFPPNNRYVPSNPADAILKFVRIGDRLVGAGCAGQVMVFKSGLYLTVREMHGSFGITSHRDMTAVGNSAWLLTPLGLVMVDMSGDLSQASSLDDLIIRDWKGSSGGGGIVYDHANGAVVVYNKARKEAVLVWLTTSTVSRLDFLEFAAMCEGYLPGGGNNKPRTAFFMKNDGRIYTMRQESEFVTGEGLVVMGDVAPAGVPGEDLVPKVYAVHSAGGIEVLHSDLNQNVRLIGVPVHVVTGKALGASAVVSSVVFLNNPQRMRLLLDRTLPGIAAGDRLAINAPKVRVTVPFVGLESEEGVIFGERNLFRQRHISAIGAHFESVSVLLSSFSGTAVEGLVAVSRFEGAVYRGLDAAPEGRSVPLNPDGSLAMSLKSGSSDLYCRTGENGIRGSVLLPTIEVVSPYHDYTLVGMRIVGSIEDTSRRRGPV